MNAQPVPSSRATPAAPLARVVLAQARAELAMTIGQSERVLVTVIMPVLLLVLFGQLIPVPSIAGKPINFLLPGILSVAIMSSGMVSLGIGTAFERYYGVLKRLGASPLPRWGLLAAKLISVLALEVLQAALLIGIAAFFYGWRPSGALWSALPIALLGTAAFVGLGMLMAGALRAEATLAAANGLFVVFLAIGGAIVPVDHLPGPVAWLAALLPPAALSDALRGALSSQSMHAQSIVSLVAWAIVLPLAAALTFKWE
jgi:ABC-2 type transport system permease protein